jgi:hypothetical protein
LTNAEIAGDQTVPSKLDLLGVTFDREGVFVGLDASVGPFDFDEGILIFPGTCTSFDTDIAENVVKLFQAVLGSRRSSAETSIAVTVMGRLIGATLAHEIAHSLLGAHVSGFESGDAFHTSASRDILLPGESWAFEHMTGVRPAEGSFADIGAHHINRPQVDGSLPFIHEFYPVPPVFK